MKKLFLFLGLILLVGSNMYISRKSDTSFKINLELLNIALADDEGSGTVKCYSSFGFQGGSSALKCGNCCYYQNHYADGEFAGTCPDKTFPDCS